MVLASVVSPTPPYDSRRPVTASAPLHETWMKVTDVCGSARSRNRAASEEPASALRWHRRSSHWASAPLNPSPGSCGRKSGLPSPAPYESPIDTTSQSWITTSLVIDSLPSELLTVSLTL